MSYQEPYNLTDSYILLIVFLNEISRWVPVSSTGKVSDDCIRDLDLLWINVVLGD